MVQATNVGDRDNATAARWFDLSRKRCVPVERQVRTSSMIVADVAGKDAIEVFLTEHDDVIETFPA